ncbi:MAG: radical SAM protein [Alphaproteobacteria bacterium]|nr:radical SAM protein [Alphaproteobacteria bacterium]
MSSPPLFRRAAAWLGRRFDPRGRLGRRVWHLRLHGPFPRLRTHRAVTAVLGPQYARSRRRIEIDLTYACNLACANCNRSVPQAPGSERMTPARIAAFVEESVQAGTRWERIRLLGGEPTLHPQFFVMLGQLRAYRDAHSPATRIEVTSNGFGPKVAAALARIPKDVHVNLSAKDETGREQAAFASFNVAPRDLPGYAGSDFANGCRIAADCGMGLAPSGYYPCAVAAGIDRVLGLGQGRAALPPEGDDMCDQMRRFCGWCGHFKRELEPAPDGQLSSPSWAAAYAAYAERRRRRRRQSGAPSA